MSRALVVEDDVVLGRTLEMNLVARGFAVDRAMTGAAALALAEAVPPDLVFLDLGLPDMDGIEVMRRLRAHSEAPVIILSARADQSTKVSALDAGAHDYITKPFGIDELFARVRAALRRLSMPPDTAVVATEDFVIDFDQKRVTRGPAAIRLTPTEWTIVEILVRNAGRVVSQENLLREVWGPDALGQTNYLRVFLTHIRRKLEPDPSQPRYFFTEPGVGLRFVGATSASEPRDNR